MILSILHLIALPIIIIASLINGLASIALVDGLVFLGLFPLEFMLWDIRLPQLSVHRHVRGRAVGYQTR